MAKVIINDTTLTQVLDGAGFCYSEVDVDYYFGADASSAELAGVIKLSARQQLNGLAGKIIWAKSRIFETSTVISMTEA